MFDGTGRLELLEVKFNSLEKRVEKLEKSLNRLGNMYVEYNELLNVQLKTIERDQEYLFERLKNLELKVFPHLAEGITHLHGIIGDGDDKANNPFDRRRP